MITKVCLKQVSPECKKVYEDAEKYFYKSENGTFGLRGSCKSCCEFSRKVGTKESNKDKIIGRRRIISNSDGSMTLECPGCKKILIATLDNFEKNTSAKIGLSLLCIECIDQQNKKWYDENKNIVAEKGKEYRLNNPEKNKERHRLYRETHPEIMKEWLAKNKSRVNKSASRRSFEIKEEVINFYGGECVVCKEKNIEFLQIDHIYNDGAKHRRDTGRASIYRLLKKNNFPSGFQVLCANHNLKKRLLLFRDKNDLTNRQIINWRHTLKIKNIVFSHYGRKCTCCGQSDLDFMHLHHINNDGADHRREIGAGSNGKISFYRWLINNDFNSDRPLETLCANCNCSLGSFNYCLHQVEKTGVF